jgi:DNA-binding CsgD family transcriptional regulator
VRTISQQNICTMPIAHSKHYEMVDSVSFWRSFHTMDSEVNFEHDRTEALAGGSEAFRTRSWRNAFTLLSAADRQSPLDPEHMLLMAQAALLIGKEQEGADALSRAHQAFLSLGQTRPAVRCAFWLGFTALLNGESAKATGWLSRATRLLQGQPECVETGYLLLPNGYRAVHSGDPIAAHSFFQQASAIAKQFGDRDLMALALQGQGRSLIRKGEIEHGLALLDEAMIAVTAGELSPLNAGGVFCSVLDACGEVFDLRRAQEWSLALKTWCDSQPDIMPYRGHCLVRRAELLSLQGSWSEALDEAKRACECLAQPSPRAALGGAYYQLGEIERMRGNLAYAEKAYEEAAKWMPNVGPGLARLRLAERKADAAHALIRRMADQVLDPARRALVLDAWVEIALAAKDIETARAASEELTSISERIAFPFVRALSSRNAGALLLADNDPQGALVPLKLSWTLWHDLQVPYEASRVRCLIARAFRDLGDEQSAALEFAAARTTFEELGASVDLACLLEQTTAKARSDPAGSLTAREVEVLRLVAAGKSNRLIGAELHISEKTVARHLSNIFTKLDLESRTAATVYAMEHKLLK